MNFAARPPIELRRFGLFYALAWGFTLTAALAALTLPGLAETVRGGLRLSLSAHAVNPADVLSIFARNALTFAIAPALAHILRPWRGGLWLTGGSAFLALVLVPNTLIVGLAAGAYGGRLVPFLPHLALEWAALAWSAATWSLSCTRELSGWTLFGLFLVNCPIILIAALVEVYATP